MLYLDGFLNHGCDSDGRPSVSGRLSVRWVTMIRRDCGRCSTGVDVLNNAMDNVYTRALPEKWVYVNVSVAPSTITITEYGVTTTTALPFVY